MNSRSHNETASLVVGLMGKGTSSVPELMVLTESILLGVILIGEKLYAQAPAKTVFMLEEALNRAVARHGEQK